MVMIQSNRFPHCQNIWVCILCRKKQELLIKTGQWIHSNMASRLKQLEAESNAPSGSSPQVTTPLFERVLSFGQSTDATGQPMVGNACLNFIRRNSLGMLPLPTSMSAKTHPIHELRRQFSHDSQPQDTRQGECYDATQQSSGAFNMFTRSPQRRHVLPQPKTKVPLNPVGSGRQLPHQSNSEPKTGTLRRLETETSFAGQRRIPDLPLQTVGRAKPLLHNLQESINQGSVPSLFQSQPSMITREPSSGVHFSAAMLQRQRSRELPLLENVLSKSVDTMNQQYTVSGTCLLCSKH